MVWSWGLLVPWLITRNYYTATALIMYALNVCSCILHACSSHMH